MANVFALQKPARRWARTAAPTTTNAEAQSTAARALERSSASTACAEKLALQAHAVLLATNAALGATAATEL